VTRSIPASLVLLGALWSCGGSSDTCVELTVTYAGSKSGPAYFRMLLDGGSAGHFATNGAAVEALSGDVTCWGGSARSVMSYVADAWIDVSGGSASACADVHAVNPDCKPLPRDPIAHQTGVIPNGQTTSVVLTLVDP
jgi:hypothetical protein